MSLFIKLIKVWLNIQPNDWSVVWSKSTKYNKTGSNIIYITYCIIYYSESRKEFSLEIKGKYNSNLLCYKQAITKLNELRNIVPNG